LKLEQAGEQRDDVGADDDDTAAGHQLSYPQLVEVTHKMTCRGKYCLLLELFHCKDKGCTVLQSKFA
jgi:hypothetical protein